tara:strand:- start:442 stop:699 length:258 start_codon:yes stop_codon:yes gene_type:complete
MPKFKKSAGYKMKGSTFYGHGSSSPNKMTLSEVRGAIKGATQAELGFKPKGYAIAAKEAQKQLKEKREEHAENLKNIAKIASLGA